MTFDQKLSNRFLILQQSVLHDPLPIPVPLIDQSRIPKLLRHFLFDSPLSAHTAEQFNGTMMNWSGFTERPDPRARAGCKIPIDGESKEAQVSTA